MRGKVSKEIRRLAYASFNSGRLKNADISFKNLNRRMKKLYKKHKNYADVLKGVIK